MALLTQLLDIPARKVILVIGYPGSGKSTYCHQTVLNALATNRPVIFIATEQGPTDVTHYLRKQGLGELLAGNLTFVDAFHETLGLSPTGRIDTVNAHCSDLTRFEVAISKLQNKFQQKNILLAFDSLTSPYLLTGSVIIKFVRQSLTKFAAAGNAVIASIAEGCGSAEELRAMMSLANGIVKTEVENGSFFLNVIKHPTVKPQRLQVPINEHPTVPPQIMDTIVTKHYEMTHDQLYDADIRIETGNFVNIWWRNFTFWSGLLWDPKRFPTLLHDLTKELSYQVGSLIMSKHPWHERLIWKVLPKRFFRIPKILQDAKVINTYKEGGMGIMEYLVESSSAEEHYMRMYESASVWGLENVGIRLCYQHPALLAGILQFFDKEKGSGRNWYAVETKCVGEGAPFCEFKLVTKELDELESYLAVIDGSTVEKIAGCLLEQIKDFIIDQKPIGERPTLGSGLHVNNFLNLLTLPALASDRYRLAVRFGGVMAGKRLGEYLMETLGLKEEETIKRIISLLDYYKIGKISLGDTIRIKENFECFGIEGDQSVHFFTSGFLNGVFSTVKNQHVKETKCIAMGDPYCEWEFR